MLAEPLWFELGCFRVHLYILRQTCIDVKVGRRAIQVLTSQSLDWESSEKHVQMNRLLVRSINEQHIARDISRYSVDGPYIMAGRLGDNLIMGALNPVDPLTSTENTGNKNNYNNVKISTSFRNTKVSIHISFISISLKPPIFCNVTWT